MKAADLDDGEVVRRIDALSRDDFGQTWSTGQRWVFTWDLAESFGVPVKVIRAKMRRLIKRGFVDGCGCGCRGDFYVTTLGAQRFGVEPYPAPYG